MPNKWVTAAFILCSPIICLQVRAGQLVLSPLSIGEYDDLNYVESAGRQPIQFQHPTTFFEVTNSRNNVSIPFQLFHHGAVLEYSIKSLPPDAIITSASLTFTVTGTQAQAPNAIPPPDQPSRIEIRMFDGLDGLTTVNDVSRSPSDFVLGQTINDVGIYTEPLSSIAYLTDRANKLSSGYLGLQFDESVQTLWASSSFSVASPPQLTINFTSAPEPASLSLLALALVPLTSRTKHRQRA